MGIYPVLRPKRSQEPERVYRAIKAKICRFQRKRKQCIYPPANAEESETPALTTVRPSAISASLQSGSVSSRTGRVTATVVKRACLPLQGGLAASFWFSALLLSSVEVYRERLRAGAQHDRGKEGVASLATSGNAKLSATHPTATLWHASRHLAG